MIFRGKISAFVKSVLFGWQPSSRLPQLALLISITSPKGHCILLMKLYDMNLMDLIMKFVTSSRRIDRQVLLDKLPPLEVLKFNKRRNY